MDRESFLETVRKQLSEEIHAAYVACSHNNKVDFENLKKRLSKMMKQAAAQNFSEREFEDLARSVIPDFKGKEEFFSQVKKAA